tara:strand:+ start:234 stop:779 length:546 start_codon:yes stop_codon:yes gene_type:complete
MLTPFYIPVFVIKIAEWENKKERLLSLVDWNNSAAIKDDHFTDYHLNGEKGCPYRDEFEEILSEEFQVLAERLQANLIIRDVWAQKYAKEKFMHVHTHGTQGFSCVLYAEFEPSKHESTTFIAPFNNFVNNDNLYFKPEVTEGTILIFPSMLMHYATPNTSTVPRTIFSVNIKPVQVAQNG